MIRKDKKAARIGLTAHTAILHKLVSMGFEVLQPLSDDLRYDLAYYVEETAELIRIQCKAGRYEPEVGCIFFKNFKEIKHASFSMLLTWAERVKDKNETIEAMPKNSASIVQKQGKYI